MLRNVWYLTMLQSKIFHSKELSKWWWRGIHFSEREWRGESFFTVARVPYLWLWLRLLHFDCQLPSFSFWVFWIFWRSESGQTNGRRLQKDKIEEKKDKERQREREEREQHFWEERRRERENVKEDRQHDESENEGKAPREGSRKQKRSAFCVVPLRQNECENGCQKR